MRAKFLLSKTFLIALLTAGISLAAPLTWTLQNVTFTDGGAATGSFVFDSSSNTVISYSISVAGGNTANFPAFVYQNGAANNTGATVYTAQSVIAFLTNIGQPSDQRELNLPVLPLPAGGGAVSLNLANNLGAECFNCFPYRLFASGQVIASAAPTPTAVPALSPAPLAALGILVAACAVALSRLPRSGLS